MINYYKRWLGAILMFLGFAITMFGRAVYETPLDNGFWLRIAGGIVIFLGILLQSIQWYREKTGNSEF